MTNDENAAKSSMNSKLKMQHVRSDISTTVVGLGENSLSYSPHQIKTKIQYFFHFLLFLAHLLKSTVNLNTIVYVRVSMKYTVF